MPGWSRAVLCKTQEKLSQTRKAVRQGGTGTRRQEEPVNFVSSRNNNSCLPYVFSSISWRHTETKIHNAARSYLPVDTNATFWTHLYTQLHRQLYMLLTSSPQLGSLGRRSKLAIIEYFWITRSQQQKAERNYNGLCQKMIMQLLFCVEKECLPPSHLQVWRRPTFLLSAANPCDSNYCKRMRTHHRLDWWYKQNKQAIHLI